MSKFNSNKIDLYKYLQIHYTTDDKVKLQEFVEALESGMCEVIKIPLKRKDGRRSGKGNP